MKKQIIVPFQVTTWETTEYDAQDEPLKLSQVLVRKTLEPPMTGTSEGQLLMCAGPDGAGYTIVDRFAVEIDGKKGTFVALHGGITDEMKAAGRIVPGSGTGELAGISGELEFKSDESGKRIILDYTLAA
jgi:hypothetical protein